MYHDNGNIAIKKKAKKGLLFFALLLSIFSFSGAVTIAQQNSPHAQSEQLLSVARKTKSCISYKQATQQLYKTQSQALQSKSAFAAAIIIFDRETATLHLHLAGLRLPDKGMIFRQYVNIPHATEPALSLS